MTDKNSGFSSWKMYRWKNVGGCLLTVPQVTLVIRNNNRQRGGVKESKPLQSFQEWNEMFATGGYNHPSDSCCFTFFFFCRKCILSITSYKFVLSFQSSALTPTCRFSFSQTITSSNETKYVFSRLFYNRLDVRRRAMPWTWPSTGWLRRPVTCADRSVHLEAVHRIAFILILGVSKNTLCPSP